MTVVATDYPFLNIMWSTLVFVGFVMWIWLAISVFADIFRRRDMGGFVKALWILAVFVLPLMGVLIYLIAYSKGIAERTGKQQEAAQQMFDQRVREAAGTSGPASEIATAQKLLEAGSINQAEFDAIKSNALTA